MSFTNNVVIMFTQRLQSILFAKHLTVIVFRQQQSWAQRLSWSLAVAIVTMFTHKQQNGSRASSSQTTHADCSGKRWSLNIPDERNLFGLGGRAWYEG